MDEWSKTVAETGQPYRWVQWLCGLQFLDDDPTKLSVGLSHSHMSETVERLRARVHHRLSLQKQLAALGSSHPLISDSVTRQVNYCCPLYILHCFKFPGVCVYQEGMYLPRIGPFAKLDDFWLSYHKYKKREVFSETHCSIILTWAYWHFAIFQSFKATEPQSALLKHTEKDANVSFLTETNDRRA